MIKGLYFKLNMDKRPDKDIYYFFKNESKRTNKTKIEILTEMMSLYYHRYNDELTKYYVGEVLK